MSLLARRQAMAAKLRLMSRLREALESRPDVQALFVGATTLDEVLSLLAEVYRGGAAAGPAGELEAVLLRVVEHCREQLGSDQSLSQPELLAVSIAELVATDSGELASACDSVRAKLRLGRRAGMNMGRRDNS